MAAASTPIKVDERTDALIAHVSHFLRCSKKDLVDTAVREYVDNHRAELDVAVKAALRELDGSTASAVRLLASASDDELAQFGGMSGA